MAKECLQDLIDDGESGKDFKEIPEFESTLSKLEREILFEYDRMDEEIKKDVFEELKAVLGSKLTRRELHKRIRPLRRRPSLKLRILAKKMRKAENKMNKFEKLVSQLYQT